MVGLEGQVHQSNKRTFRCSFYLLTYFAVKWEVVSEICIEQLHYVDHSLSTPFFPGCVFYKPFYNVLIQLCWHCHKQRSCYIYHSNMQPTRYNFTPRKKDKTSQANEFSEGRRAGNNTNTDCLQSSSSPLPQTEKQATLKTAGSTVNEYLRACQLGWIETKQFHSFIHVKIDILVN